MPRLTPLCPLKIHLSGGGRRELKEEVKSQTKAPGFMFGPSAHKATDPPASLHREHGQLCQTMLALLSLLKSTTSTSPPCSEHSKEVSVWRRKIMACSLFHFELISACLVILNHAGFQLPTCCIFPCWGLSLRQLHILKHFLNPFFFAGHFLLHIKHASHLISSTFRSHLLFSEEYEREKKYQTSAKAVKRQYKSSLDFSPYKLKVVKNQMLTTLKSLFFHPDTDKWGT